MNQKAFPKLIFVIFFVDIKKAPMTKKKIPKYFIGAKNSPRKIKARIKMNNRAK